MDNSKSKSQAAAPEETPSADRRAFMRTVVTGTAVAGLAACTSAVEASTGASALAQCAEPVKVPKGVVRASILLNNSGEITLDRIHEWIDDLFGESGCPTCGIFGDPGDGNDTDPGTIDYVELKPAYLPPEIPKLVVFTDSRSSRC